MPRNTVVYGYRIGWWRAVAATTTKKAAREAFGISQSEFNNYVSVTGNELDIAAAMSQPGTPFIQPLSARGDDRYKWWVKDGFRPWKQREPDLILEKEDE